MILLTFFCDMWFFKSMDGLTTRWVLSSLQSNWRGFLRRSLSVWKVKPRKQKEKYRHFKFHQWSTRPDPQSRQLWSLFSLELCFVKFGTDGRTDNTCKNSDHYRGRPCGSKISSLASLDFCNWSTEHAANLPSQRNNSERILPKVIASFHDITK